MVLILLYFLILKLQSSQSQFPNHIDLQKVGEITFKYEKYNILKPSVHVVRDYFKDFMLRRGTYDFPTKRVFIDDNGFRHYWSGMEYVDNLRKSEHSSDKAVNTKDSVVNAKVAAVNPKDSAVKTKVAAVNPKVTAVDAKVTADNIAILNTTALRKKPHRKKKLSQIIAEYKAVSETNVLRSGRERTLAKTTFFCPFFGVVTMSTFLD